MGVIKSSLRFSLMLGVMMGLGVVSVLAQSIPEASAPGLSILDVSFGARGLALAEVMQAMPADRMSLYNNPATSAFAPQIVVIAGGQNMGFVNSAGLIGVFPFTFGTLSVGFRGANVQGIEVRPDPADPDYYLDNTNASAFATALSFSRRFGSFSAGLALRVQTVSLGTNPYAEDSEFQAASVGVDLGAYQELGELGLGLVVQNLGPRMRFDLAGSDTLAGDTATSNGTLQPLYVAGSARYGFLSDKLQLLAGAGYGARGLVISGAIEYSPWRLLSLRMGYTSERIAGNFINGLATGFGLELANLEINYSYLPNTYFGAGGIHGLDIGFHFGASEAERERLLAEARKEAEKEALERMKLTSQSLYEQGMTSYNMGRYDEALASWDLALIWWPENTQAQGMIAKVNAEKEQMALNSLVEGAKKAYVSKNYVALVVLAQEILAQDSTHSLALFYQEDAEEGVTKELIASAPVVIQDDLRKGIEALATQDYLTAMRSFEKVLDYDRDNEVARDYMRKTKEEIDRYISAEIEEVGALLGRSRYSEAKSKVRGLLRLAPQNAELLQKLGEIDRRLSEDVQRRLARAKETQDPARSEKELRAALQLDPANIEVQQNLAEIEKAAKKAADVQKLYLLGVESYSENNYELAISYWEKVLATDPDHTNARKNMARAQAKLAALARVGG